MSIKLFISGFVVVLFSIITLPSCDECGDFPKGSMTKITGLISNIKEVTALDTSNNNLTLSSSFNDSILYSNFAISILPKIEPIAYSKPKLNFSLIPSAYACETPPFPDQGPKVDSIVITSSKDFNSDFLAGSNLIPLFDAFEMYNQDNKYSLKLNLEDYIQFNPYIANNLSLVLKSKPFVTTDFEFSITYYQQGLTDQNFYSITTRKVTIKRE